MSDSTPAKGEETIAANAPGDDADGQEKSITLRGIVSRKGETNGQLAGALIFARHDDGTTQEAETDSGGRYRLEKLKPGKWRIVAWKGIPSVFRSMC